MRFDRKPAPSSIDAPSSSSPFLPTMIDAQAVDEMDASAAQKPPSSESGRLLLRLRRRPSLSGWSILSKPDSEGVVLRVDSDVRPSPKKRGKGKEAAMAPRPKRTRIASPQAASTPVDQTRQRKQKRAAPTPASTRSQSSKLTRSGKKF